MKHPEQSDLFAPDVIGPEVKGPPHFMYRDEFITEREEAGLLDAVAMLPFQQASYRQWTARRRIVSFGGKYDFTHHELHPAEPVPAFLHPLRARMAEWVGVDADAFPALFRSGRRSFDSR